MCAFAHPTNRGRENQDLLEKEVSVLKEEVKQLCAANACINDELNNIEILKKEVKTLKESIHEMTTTLKDTEDLVKQLVVQTHTKDNAILKEGDNMLHCKLCDYSCKREATLRKHSNTKHPERKYKCNKCDISFKSNDMLKQHVNSEHKGNIEVDVDTEQCGQKDTEVSECSICDNKFISEEDYTNHVKEHLQEIKEIDIEYLKSGHEIFECNTCKFKSNIPEVIKAHLAKHVLQPKDKNVIKTKTKEYKKAMLSSKNWRDMFNNEGDPIFDSTDSDESSSYEE